MLSRFQFPSQTNSLPFLSHLDKALTPLGPYKTYAAAIGAAFVAYKAAQSVGCVARGLVSYFLAEPLHLAVDLRRAGDWAGIVLCYV